MIVKKYEFKVQLLAEGMTRRKIEIHTGISRKQDLVF